VLGSAKERQQTNPPDHARELKELVVKDEEGADVRLGDLWRDRPAVLVFLRHYGCTFCRANVVSFSRDREKFETAGVRLAAIGHGTPDQAAWFRRKQKVKIALLVDPGRMSYEAAGAKLGVFSEILGARVLARGVKRAIKSGVRPGRVRGEAAQLGGVLVVAPDGSVRYAYLSDDASDNPPTSEVLAAARAIRPHLRAFPAAGPDGAWTPEVPSGLPEEERGELDPGALLDVAMRTWSVRELSAFLDRVRSDRLYALWLLLTTTGMWPDEALALRWEDVHLDERRLSVRRALVPIGTSLGWSELRPGRGRRDVSLDPATAAALRIHRRTQIVERVAAGDAYSDLGLVFAAENGSLIHPDRASELFDERVWAAGLPRIRLTDLRHTHATLALQAGVRASVVSQRLGHASESRTVGSYWHALAAGEEPARPEEVLLGP
jgi:peroxiredoxin